MPKEKNTDAEQAAEFDLKHRITGAAVLLFFGALVLPWLLGPPSEASKSITTDTPPSVVDISNDSVPVAIEPLEDTPIIDVEETVYISKITPLDAKRNKELVEAANNAADKAVAEPAVDAANTDASAKATVKPAVDTAEVKKQEEAKKAQTASKREADEQAEREKALQAALAAETELKNSAADPKPEPQPPVVTVPKVDVGWVVQVGLFAERDRAIALISQLEGKGFKVSSRIVDTNRGKGTGTRIWLGPFAKRISAVNENDRLKKKMGKDGYIRVYPFPS